MGPGYLPDMITTVRKRRMFNLRRWVEDAADNFYGEFIMLSVIKTEEAGYRSAMQGLALSKKQPIRNMPALALKLAFMDGGHNKFLESMFIWLEVRASRYWWQEADTFRLASKQSESTMHTLINEIKDFEIGDMKTTSPEYKFMRKNFEPGSVCTEQFNALIIHAKDGDIVKCKANLPEGFLQTRLWRFDYKCFRNIILQRRTHKLPHWKKFIVNTLEQVDHPELLPTWEVK